MPIYRLEEAPIFPDPTHAEPDGLLAVGGDLTPERLVNAYGNGIFPWYSEGEPMLWYSPDPRMILHPENLKISKTLTRLIKSQKYEQRIDTQFEAVIRNCSQAPRPDQDGTWITEEMIVAYIKLHQLGLAHSFETYQDGNLIGGLYGISLGKAFFGESMYHHSRDASKTAFAHLCQFAQDHDFHFIDAQVPSEHLERLGAQEVTREDFLNQLQKSNNNPTLQNSWCELG